MDLSVSLSHSLTVFLWLLWCVGATPEDDDAGSDQRSTRSSSAKSVSDWDEGEEPTGSASEFRFDLAEMKVDKILGKGSFATVHMGTVDGRQAAIKCMRKTRLRLETQGAFVQREREILRQLCTPKHHPLIINCFGTAQVRSPTGLSFAFGCSSTDVRLVLINQAPACIATYT